LTNDDGAEGSVKGDRSGHKHRRAGVGRGREILKLADADRLEARDDSRSAEADRDHLFAFALLDRHHPAKAAAMF
jgi:hypothetical protein